MATPTKTSQVIIEMDRYHLVVLGISEMRWPEAVKRLVENAKLTIHSARDDGKYQEGVGIIMSNLAAENLIEREPVNIRIIRA